MKDKEENITFKSIRERILDFNKMSVSVEPVTTRALGLGEGPHWDHRSQTLYFIGITDKSLHKYVPATGEHTRTYVDGNVSFIIPVEGHPNHFVITQNREFVVVQWDGGEGSEVRTVKRLGEVDPNEPGSILNDGKVDTRGRLYAGTMLYTHTAVKERGALYRVDQRGVSKVTDKITLANGLGWSIDNKAMYYIDSVERNIRRYDYDVETGDISNLQYIFDYAKHGVIGDPDGMTIDADGNLWVANFNREGVPGSVIQVSPQGELLRQVSIPVAGVASCTFGGPNLDVLYVTTGFLGFATQHAREPLAGRTFKVTGLGVKGTLNNNFKL